MSVSSLALDSSWVDYYGVWNTFVEPQFSPLEKSYCHAPRLALVPSTENQVVPPLGKIQYNFFLVPGSVIWGFWILPDFSVQLTDISLGHQFFQEPCGSELLATTGAQFGRFPSYTLLPTPHPVVGDGLFMLEAWGAPGSAFYMVLGVAEVTKCPVR